MECETVASRASYRCPYCHIPLEALPLTGVCPSCRHVMRLPPGTPSPVDLRAHRRALERVKREIEIKRQELGPVFNSRVLYGPRFLLAMVGVLGLTGALLVASSRKASRSQAPQPHTLALHEMDRLAVALGRFRVHVGDYPAPTLGLSALLNDPGARGWLGPYVNLIHRDPWGTPYRYERATNGTVRLYTSGPDRLPGTPDDLRADPAAFDVGTAWTTGWVRAADRLPGVWIQPTAPALNESDAAAPPQDAQNPL